MVAYKGRGLILAPRPDSHIFLDAAMHKRWLQWVIFFRHAALLVMEGLPPKAERLAGSTRFGSLPPNSFRGRWLRATEKIGPKATVSICHKR